LFLVQAAGTALIIRQADYATGYNYDQLLLIVATALGIVGAIAIGRYFAKKGKARGAATDAGPPSTGDDKVLIPACSAATWSRCDVEHAAQKPFARSKLSFGPPDHLGARGGSYGR
jgi:hypothetical protein